MIRKFRPTDTDQIIRIWLKASSLAHPFLSDAMVEKVKQDIKGLYLPNSNTWVYEEANQLIGFISMNGNEIGGLFVLPEEHSRGIGTVLVDFAARQHHSLEVEVFEKNAIGRAFYQKCGFSCQASYWHEESKEMVLRLHCPSQKLQFTYPILVP